MLRIQPGIAMLSIAAPVMGRMDTVHPVLVWDDVDVVLIDTGFPGQLEQLKEAVERAGARFERLSRIILTHQDIDHIGNLPQAIGAASEPIEVVAHPVEKPYIEGEKRLLRFTDEAIASVDRMPAAVPASFRDGLKALMLHPPRAKVQRVATDGDLLPWCGGLRVVETPGHTPGHLSLLHESSGTLIAGDALVAKDGRLDGFDPETTLDPATAEASVAKLRALSVTGVVCYHGGYVPGPVL